MAADAELGTGGDCDGFCIRIINGRSPSTDVDHGRRVSREKQKS